MPEAGWPRVHQLQLTSRSNSHTEVGSVDHQTLYGETNERRTLRVWRKHPRLAHSSENEQTPDNPILQSYTCSFSDECDSAPPAYPFLHRSFLMAGGKKSRAGDAVGRRAKRAGVPELSHFRKRAVGIADSLPRHSFRRCFYGWAVEESNL